MSIGKILSASGLLTCALTLSACNEQKVPSGQKVDKPAAEVQASKSLVVYFSQKGATKKVAEIFKNARKADVLELALVEPYPNDYDSTVAKVQVQRESKKWPALVNAKADLAKYDTVYLGYPIMFGTFAPPIYTFLDSNDLSGKVVVPFCTYGSGGRKVSAEELKLLEPKANVTLAYGISNKRISAEKGAEVAAKEIEGFFGDLETGKTEEMLMGAFSEQEPLTAEDSAVFAKATKDYAYLNLKPLSVSRQIVAGVNYLFLCQMQAFSGKTAETNVRVFAPLPGRGEPELLAVEK